MAAGPPSRWEALAGGSSPGARGPLPAVCPRQPAFCSVPSPEPASGSTVPRVPLWLAARWGLSSALLLPPGRPRPSSSHLPSPHRPSLLWSLPGACSIPASRAAGHRVGGPPVSPGGQEEPLPRITVTPERGGRVTRSHIQPLPGPAKYLLQRHPWEQPFSAAAPAEPAAAAQPPGFASPGGSRGSAQPRGRGAGEEGGRGGWQRGGDALPRYGCPQPGTGR